MSCTHQPTDDECNRQLEAVLGFRFLNNSISPAYNSARFQGLFMRPDLDMWESRHDELLT
jgi:hypothetical protein